MYVSWTSHGQGNPQDAINYILAPKDAKGAQRAGIRILRGDPQLVAKVAGALDFKWRYKSGSLGFSPEEKLTEAELQELLNDLERVAFSGLSSHRNCWTAVEHRRPNGGVDIHIVHAMVDLQSGKSVNIAPPGWQKTWDPFRNSWNWKLGLARPDDERRMQDVQPARHEAFIAASDLRASLAAQPTDAPTTRARIGAWLEAGVRAGALTDRASVLAALTKAAQHGGGSITRAGGDYISLRLQPGARPLRLRGALLDEQFDAAQWLEADRERSVRVPGHDLVVGSSGRGGDVDLERARAERRRLVPQLEAAAARNRKRYGPDAELGRIGIESDVDGHRDRAPGEGAGPARPATQSARSEGEDAWFAAGRIDGPDGDGSQGARTGAAGTDRVEPRANDDRSADGAPAPSQSPALGRAHTDRDDGGGLRVGDRGDMGLRAVAGRRGAGGASAARAVPAPGPAKPSRKRKAAAMNVPSVVDQLLSLAQARAASAFVPFNHHQEQSMSIPDPSTATTSTPPPAVAAPARPSLRDSLRFDVAPKKTAVAAAAAGVDLDRPRPPAVKSEAGELAPIEFGPGWLSRILEAFRSLLMRLLGGLWGPSPIPPGTVVTGEAGEPAQDGRDALIQLLKEELAETRAELARLRAAATAAGLDLDHADRAEDAVVKSFEAADRALALDKARDAARAKREGVELPGEDHLRRLRSTSFAVAAVVPADRPQALQAMEKAREDAATWSSSVAAAARRAPDGHPLKIQAEAIAEANTMADAAADAVAALAGQAAADVEAADEEAAAGPDRAPSRLDQIDPTRGAALRAQWVEINRRIRRLHAHVVDLPKPNDEELQALPTPADRVAALTAHGEALRLAQAAYYEELAELGEQQRALARELWPADDLDDDTDHERPGRV